MNILPSSDIQQNYDKTSGIFRLEIELLTLEEEYARGEFTPAEEVIRNRARRPTM